MQPLKSRETLKFMNVIGPFGKKNLRIFCFQKPLWLDNRLPTARIRVVALSSKMKWKPFLPSPPFFTELNAFTERDILKQLCNVICFPKKSEYYNF